MIDENEILKVCDKMCNQCLYTSKAIVDEQRKAEIQGDQDPNHWFICHKATLKGKKVMCRGYYEANKDGLFIKLAEKLGRISFVNVENNSRTLTMLEKKASLARMERFQQLKEIFESRQKTKS